MSNIMKELIEFRLGRSIIEDEFFDSDSYFIKIKKEYLHAALFFLKNDPDTRLSLLDQIIAIDSGSLSFVKPSSENILEVLYQIKSIKLPYRVTIAIEAVKNDILPSVCHLFLGAKWFQEEIEKQYGISFEEDEKKFTN